MAVLQFEDRIPVIGSGTNVCESAEVIGKVTIGKNCYIGFGARLRGDYGEIIIGDRSIVEDNCVIHARPDEQCIIGNRVTIGHGQFSIIVQSAIKLLSAWARSSVITPKLANGQLSEKAAWYLISSRSLQVKLQWVYPPRSSQILPMNSKISGASTRIFMSI